MKHTLYIIALLSLSFSLLTYTADEDVVTVNSDNEASVKIPVRAMRYTKLYGIDDDWSDTMYLLHREQRELNLLKHVLHIIDECIEEAAIATLCTRWIPGNELALAGLDSDCKIPILQKALMRFIASLDVMKKADSMPQKKALKVDSERQLELAHQDMQLTPLQRNGACRLSELIAYEEIAAKKFFFESKGADRSPFFTGVSIGECAQHGLITRLYASDINPREYVDPAKNVADYVLQCKCDVERQDIISLDGLKCENVTKELHLTGMGIVELPSKCFQYAGQPKIMWLQSNHISRINRRAFAGLTALTYLDLGNNNLTGFEPGTFDPLTKLGALILSNCRYYTGPKNKITHLNPALFEHCENLELINLEGNPLTNPLATQKALCAAFPKVRVVID